MSLARALALSFRQLGDRAIVGILVKSLAITLAIFIALGALLTFGFQLLAERYEWEAVQGLGALLVALIIVLAGWLLFRFVALFVLQFFAEDVVRAVEGRHYPHVVGTARSVPFAEEMRRGTRSTLRALAFNLLALPVAIALLVTGVGTALLFWAVNALLLGRELQDMVWMRHRGDGDRPPVGAGRRFALGGVVAGMLSLPFVNLIAPVIGAATATHLVHGTKEHA